MGRLLRTITGVAVLVLSGTPAAAARWRFITAFTAPIPGMVFGDEDSIRLHGRHRKIMKHQTVFIPGPGIRDRVELDEYDCARKRERRLSLTGHDLHGRVVATDNRPTRWEGVLADTNGEAAMQNACRGFPANAFTVDSPVRDGRMLMSQAPPPNISRLVPID